MKIKSISIIALIFLLPFFSGCSSTSIGEKISLDVKPQVSNKETKEILADRKYVVFYSITGDKLALNSIDFVPDYSLLSDFYQENKKQDSDTPKYTDCVIISKGDVYSSCQTGDWEGSLYTYRETRSASHAIGMVIFSPFILLEKAVEGSDKTSAIEYSGTDTQTNQNQVDKFGAYVAQELAYQIKMAGSNYRSFKALVNKYPYAQLENNAYLRSRVKSFVQSDINKANSYANISHLRSALSLFNKFEYQTEECISSTSEVTLRKSSDITSKVVGHTPKYKKFCGIKKMSDGFVRVDKYYADRGEFNYVKNTKKRADSLTVAIRKLKEKIVALYAKQNNFTDYLMAYQISGKSAYLTNAQRAIKTQKKGINAPSDLINLYFNHQVKTLSDIPSFYDAMLKINGYPNNQAVAKVFGTRIKSLPDFGKHITSGNFTKSNEFKYVLQYETPNVSVSNGGDEYKLSLSYSDYKVGFKNSAECSYEKSYQKTSDLGFFEGIGAAIGNKNITDKTVYYDRYKCHIPSSSAALMSNIEKRAVGKVAKTSEWVKGKSWTYNKSTGKVYNRGSSSYSQPQYSSTSASSSSSSNSSSGSAHVTSKVKDGNYTIVKCSIGKDTKIHHDSYGKCSDNYNMGSYSCSSVMKWAEERCEGR